MAIVTPIITTGAVTGSVAVKVTLAENGTSIVLHRGAFFLGQGNIVGGTVTIAVLSLARGDIIVASVSERGNRASVPYTVVDDVTRPTGWRNPTTVTQNGTSLTAAAYEFTTGLKPLGSYDPALVVPPVAPDLQVQSVPLAAPIIFDVRIEQSAGSTLVTVENVINASGGPLVRFGPTGAFSNTLSKSYTAAQSLTIYVRGDGDDASRTVSKTVSVGVFAPPVTAPLSSDITALSSRWFDQFLRAMANSFKQCECRLEGYDMTWQKMIFYDVDYQEGSYHPVPSGTYKLWVRVEGDTNPDNWRFVNIVRN